MGLIDRLKQVFGRGRQGQDQTAYFSYHRYLVAIVTSSTASVADRSDALRELRRREDLRRTLDVITFLVYVSVAVVALGQLFLFLRGSDLAAAGRWWVAALEAMAAAFGAVLWALAWYLSGALVGFLFGIPRVQQRDAAPQKPATGNAEYWQQVNTNIEQISDWLTKIIVGLGLVNLKQIPQRVGDAANFMANNSCGTRCTPFAAAVLTEFSVLGFFAGYLLTRMFLAPAFARADISSGLTDEEKKQLLETPVGPSAGGAATQSALGDPAVRETARKVGDLPASPDETAEQKRTRAKAMLLNGQFSAAAKEYEGLVSAFQDQIDVRIEYCWALFKANGSNWADSIAPQIEYVLKTAEAAEPQSRERAYAAATFYYLYRPGGYEKALNLAQRYLAERNNLASSDILLNAACALGQRYITLTWEQEKRRTREDALQYLQRAIQINPAVVDTIRHLMNGSDPRENDLQPFREFEEFQRLVQ